MYTKILVAVDLEDFSLDVINKGKALAELYQAELKVIHCEEHRVGYGGQTKLHPEMTDTHIRHETMPALRALAESAGLDHEQYHIEIGHPADTVVELAEKENYDLIVVGSHGRRGIRSLLGSVCNDILHHAPCDVLACRMK